MSDVCPICRQSDAQVQVTPGSLYFIHCSQCGQFGIDHIFFQVGQREWLHPEHHLISAAIREATDRCESIRIPYAIEALQTLVDRSPRSVEEKSHKLLERLITYSPYFGYELALDRGAFILYSYAAHADEAFAICKYLEELGYLTFISTIGGIRTVIKAPGYKALEYRSLLPPLSIFISSTCYDLLDLRAELTTYLEMRGCLVKVSEDPAHFVIDPTADSIETCFRNIDSSDLVVCIIDKRYGPVLGKGGYQDVSATHAEILYARECSPPKPILFFARERAWGDYSILRTAPDAKTKWVEPERADYRALWVKFVSDLAAIPEHRQRSNWITMFRSSVDLKSLVSKQLADYRAKR